MTLFPGSKVTHVFELGLSIFCHMAISEEVVVAVVTCVGLHHYDVIHTKKFLLLS